MKNTNTSATERAEETDLVRVVSVLLSVSRGTSSECVEGQHLAGSCAGDAGERTEGDVCRAEEVHRLPHLSRCDSTR